MLKATKVRIYPTLEQADFLNQQFGAVRFAYNKALATMSHRYKVHGESLSAKHDLKPILAVAKKSNRYSWLKQYDSIALQQSLINLDKAFKSFFDKSLPARYPHFKKRYQRQSSYHCTCISTGEDWIKIPKMKPIEAKIHREIEGKVKSITLTKEVTGKYYASILVEDGVAMLEPIAAINEDKVVGIDAGITSLLALSSGEKVENPRFTKRAEKNLKRKQQALSRKKRGSKGRAKARLIVAKCHDKVKNSRSDLQHKLSRRLVDENQAIAVETLKVKNMMKNRRLAKHIADASWSSLIEKIEYKSKEQGKHCVKIDQWFASSKTCSHCGEKMENMPLHIRQWDCPTCGVKDIDRDTNAAINIKRQGLLKLMAGGRSLLRMEACVSPVMLPAAA